MTLTLRYIVMPRALQATPSLLTYSARPPLGSIVEGAAIQPDEPVKVLVKCRQNVANKLFIIRYFNPAVPTHLRTCNELTVLG